MSWRTVVGWPSQARLWGNIQTGWHFESRKECYEGQATNQARRNQRASIWPLGNQQASRSTRFQPTAASPLQSQKPLQSLTPLQVQDAESIADDAASFVSRAACLSTRSVACIYFCLSYTAGRQQLDEWNCYLHAQIKPKRIRIQKFPSTFRWNMPGSLLIRRCHADV